mmetsp:Transcript_65007/g.113336  ORF Transcript_65007/g.113336 Transcript_65007/m.113336 type:complete len:205 (-) Transcript_65007:864-1478(-)
MVFELEETETQRASDIVVSATLSVTDEADLFDEGLRCFEPLLLALALRSCKRLLADVLDNCLTHFCCIYGPWQVPDAEPQRMNCEVWIVDTPFSLFHGGLTLPLLGLRELRPFVLVVFVDFADMKQMHPGASFLGSSTFLWFAVCRSILNFIWSHGLFQDQSATSQGNAEAIYGCQLTPVTTLHNRRELLEFAICICFNFQSRI